MTPSSRPLAERVTAALSGRSLTDQKLLFTGILNDALPNGVDAVLVGGSAVEAYTRGRYVSGDADFVGNATILRALIEDAGFERAGRVFIHPQIGLVVDVAGSHLGKGERVTTLEFEGYRIPVVSIEDLVVDRLNAAVHWKSPTDLEQAILLLATHTSRVDRERLRENARANGVEEALRDVEARIASGG